LSHQSILGGENDAKQPNGRHDASRSSARSFYRLKFSK
jgi:hypothetical protein